MTDKPEVDFPGGEAPDVLVVTDVTVGDGPEATAGATVQVHYLGVEFESGEEFDSSWSRGESINFPLGNLIKGWQEGHPWHEGRWTPSADLPTGSRLRSSGWGTPALRQDTDLRDRPARRQLIAALLSRSPACRPAAAAAMKAASS